MIKSGAKSESRELGEMTEIKMARKPEYNSMDRRSFIKGCAAGASMALIAGSCGGGQTEQATAALAKRPERMNVLLVTIDTLRGDYLGCYGNTEVETPEIDRIAAEGVRFDFCAAHNTITLPSHINILTGTDPRTHGVHDNTGFRLEPESVMISEVLKDRGYSTGAFVAAFVLDSRYKIDQGFDYYDDYYGINRPGNPMISERPADEVVDPALKWISEQRKQPWFSWVHVYDPHAPHQVSPPFDRKFANNIYAGEVSFVDFSLKRIFDFLRSSGQIDNTAIVITGDHGESRGDHGEKTHGIFAYNSTLWVPLVMRIPWSIAAGSVVERRVRHIDIVPTILDAVGTELPESLEGESLIPLVGNTDPPPAPDCYFECLSASFNRGWAPLYGVLHDKWKYIDLPIPELYDMEEDFGEENNVIASRAGTAAQLRQILGKMREGEPDPTDTRVQEDFEARQRLRALGYMTTSVELNKKTHGPDDDPKRLIGVSNRIDDGVAAATAGKWDEAEGILKGLIGQYPDLVIAYQHLAWVYNDSGRPQLSVELLDDAVRRGLGGKEILTGLAMSLQESNQLDRAIEILEALRTSHPDDLDILHYLAMGYARLKDIAKSEELFKKVLELDPSFIEARGNYGWMLLDIPGREQDAMEQFNIALSQFPFHGASLHGKGLIYERRERWGDAISAYREAIRCDRKRYEARLQLAIALTRTGQYPEAIQQLERFLSDVPPGMLTDERAGAQRLLTSLRNRR